MWRVLVLLALGPGYVLVDANKLTEIAQTCCNKGTSYAISHTLRDCSSSVPPDVPKTYYVFCKFSMDECCTEYFDKKKECDVGINEASKASSCDAITTVTGKNCCNQCIKGTATGKSTGICVGGSRGSGADEFLPTEAYELCCKNATKYKFNGPDDNKRPSHDFWRKPNPLSAAYVAPSLCEEYAPNELCAHNCIPVPGSYKCECNPGYKLMADKKNCMQITKNRCKPRNPCKHKCSDNGVEVKCSCRRGYRLMADGKSCEDIDECQENPDICVAGTKCQNIQGSHKCMLMKKNAHESGQCPAGFLRNPHNNACDDVNECTLLHPPCPAYLCENTVGGYKCGGVSGDPANLLTNPPPPPPAEDRCPPGYRSIRTDVSEDCEDVDECESYNDDCNRQSQFCINTRGSFYCQDKVSKHCPPGFKTDPVSNKCEDIDECLDSNALCSQDKVCVNVPGAYDCKPKIDFSITPNCPEGMRRRPGSSHCEDIDECLEGTHLCDQYQTCLNTNRSHECRCKPGFQLDHMTGACIDINECATDQNDCIPDSQRCDNTVGSYLCVRFISCGTGYTLQHASGKCEDIDECALGKDNCGRAGPNFMCKNIPGSFRCVRRPSSTTTTPNPDYEYYDTDDEFYNETDSEPKVATDNKKIDQSTTTTQTAPTTQVTPTQSSTASTIPTYIEPVIPTDLDTIEPEKPHVESRLSDTFDYNEPKQVAVETADKNETESYDPNDNVVQPVYNIPKEPEPPYHPEINNDNVVQPSPVPNNSDKENTDLSKTTPHIVLLEVPNETATVKVVKSDDGSLVINTFDVPKNEWTKITGSPEPNICQAGFEMDDYGACVDIDECATKRHVCSGLTEVCRNNMGGYICDCAIGFRRDQKTGACDLIPTSSTSTTTSTAAPLPSSTESKYYDYPIYHPPKSRPFRPRTLCDIGYNMNSSTGKCEDIDECTNGLATCAAVEVCVNTEGGYRCDCLPNWMYDEVKHRCIPNRGKNRFLPGNSHAPGRTEVLIGGKQDYGRKFEEPTYTKIETGRGGILKCHWGYRLSDDNTCEDIDECAIGTAQCAADQICTNHFGGYSCSCPPGHRLMDDQTCEDIDECDLAGDVPICSQNADCINTIGSYHCKCHQGFRSAPANDKVCVDVDECTESRAGLLCEQRCNNIWGGYRCSCHRGYRLNPDNKTCSDLDECTEFKSKLPCIGICLNEPGSYRCSCPKGYKLSQDKRSCIDIDECDTGEAFCATTVSGKSGSNFCFNIRGGYKCEKISCPQGYGLENRHRCTKIDTLCEIGDWDCIHQPSTYSHHYITFVSKLDIPDNKVDLYTMNVPAWPHARTKFQLRLVKADSPPTVKQRADINSFLLTSTNKNAVVSIVQSLEGPQSIELELSMELYSDGSFAGIAVAKLFIYVTEYEF